MDEGLLNDLLECSVCLERLDTSSRVLPCQHTFCLKCLKVIVESHKELRCPECRVLVEAKVEELPPNVLLMRILEGMKNSAPRKVSVVQRAPRSGHSQSQTQQGARTEAKQLPPYARALYDFISKEPGDLSFKKGDMIMLQKKLDHFWYQGECSGRTGMFPITYVQVVVALPVPTALCKALYDFRMSAPDEEGCLAFDKGAIITVHRRVDENWAEGRLDRRVGIFPIAFVELNQPARQLMNSVPLNRAVPPLPTEETRPGHSEHRHAHHPHRYQPVSLSAPPSAHGNYQNMAPMTPMTPTPHNYPPHAHSMLTQQQILVPQTVSHGPLVTNMSRNIVEPAQTKLSLDFINHFVNVNNKTVGIQNVRNNDYERMRVGKFEHYTQKPDTTYQNVRAHEHCPISVANFNTNVSSDSSSSMNTPSVVSSTTPNTSSNTSTCGSAEPSLPSSPDNTERNATVNTTNTVQNPITELPNDNEADTSINTSMGVLSLNESSTATNTSLNVSLPPTESPKMASQNQNEIVENDTSRLDVPSSSKNIRTSGPDSLLNFGLGLQAALSPSHGKDGNYLSRSHREHHREKRHSLTPSTHLQGNHTPINRHSAEILATSLLDHAPERDRKRTEREGERRRRRSRSNERPLPAAYVAMYPYKPQKSDELELKKGGVYTVTERCRDGWYKGYSESSQRCGVFPGNYVAATHAQHAAHAQHHAAPTHHQPRPKHDKVVVQANPKSTQAPPDAPPRAASPTTVQPLTYPWNAQSSQPQAAAKTDKPKEKTKSEKISISTGVSLMKRLAAMKKCKSPPPVGYSMDNPVFEDGPGPSLASPHPVHVRSGSCPSQLLRTLPGGGSGGGSGDRGERARLKERPPMLALHDHRLHSEGPSSFEEVSPSDLAELQAHKSGSERRQSSDTTISAASLQSEHTPTGITPTEDKSQQYVSEFLERYVLDSDTDSEGRRFPIIKPNTTIREDSHRELESEASNTLVGEPPLVDEQDAKDNKKRIKTRLSEAATGIMGAMSSRLAYITGSNSIRPTQEELAVRTNLDALIARSPSDEFIFSVPRDPLLSPYWADDHLLNNFPPVRILTVHLDPCLDDCVMFAKKLKKLGNEVGIDVLEGLPHGFLNFSLMAKEANEGSKLCVERIKQLLDLESESSSTGEEDL